MKIHRYIISFSVKNKTKRAGVIEYLNEGTCFEITPSSYFFESPKDVIQIHKDWNAIKPLSQDDVFYVFSICQPWTGHGDFALTDHLRKIRGSQTPTDAKED